MSLVHQSEEVREIDEEEKKDQRELKEYIKEILLIITTGDEEVDKLNIDLVSENVHAKTK